MSQLYKIDSSRTNCWRTTKDRLFFYLILAITCKSVSRYLIETKYYAIRDFYRHSESCALPYPEALARRGRYGITILTLEIDLPRLSNRINSNYHDSNQLIDSNSINRPDAISLQQLLFNRKFKLVIESSR